MNRGAGRALTGLGLLVAVVGIASATSNILSLLWLRSEDATSSYAASASLRVDSNCGDVDVVAGDVATIELSTNVWWSFGKPSVTTTLDGATRVVTVRCASASFGTGNSANASLIVPEDTAVTVRASAGHVRLEGLGGDITAHSSDGWVEGVDLVAAHVTASSSAGAVRLAFASPPVEVDARSSAGRVDVLVPDDDTSYAVTATSSAGRADVTVATDPTSPARIFAKSSASDVRVDYSD